MELELYTITTRYLTTFVFSFFVYQFIISIINFRSHKDSSSIWHTLMCFTTALYCFVFAFNTHNYNQFLSNLLLGVFWICAYSSFYCYIKAVEAFMKKRLELLIIPKVYCLFLAGVHILNILSILFFDLNILFKEKLEQTTLFANTMSFTISPSFGTLSLGAFGAVMVIFSGIIIWLSLNKSGKKEYMLKAGIIVTILCVLNDSALGLELSGSLIPLYYLGNAFEAFRFNLYYQKLASDKIHSLEAEVGELAKVAQFGTAAASISHDIRNYLMVMQLSLRNAAKGLQVEASIERANKYIEKSVSVANIYMNLFKHSNDLKIKNYKIYDIIEGAKEILEDRLNTARVELIIDVPKGLEIKCNEVALTLALVNLMGNAIDEILRHDKPWIKISYNPQKYELYIIDSGKGIPKEVAENIFTMNYSTKKNSGGSGLGLSITRQIIQKCGFDIGLDEDKENTTFVIYLGGKS